LKLTNQPIQQIGLVCSKSLHAHTGAAASREDLPRPTAVGALFSGDLWINGISYAANVDIGRGGELSELTPSQLFGVAIVVQHIPHGLDRVAGISRK